MVVNKMLNACLTTSTATTITPTSDSNLPGAGYLPVRLYIPVSGHSVTFNDNPIPFGSSQNDPRGILPHQSESDVTVSQANTTTNGFLNSMAPYGAWELAITLRGTAQRLVVGTHLPTDATDARGYAINGNVNYRLGTGVYGMTGDQLRNEILFLAARSADFVTTPLYYMYPLWRFRPDPATPGQFLNDPHFFRGTVRNFTVGDESGTFESYDFNVTFAVANVKPQS